MTDTITIDKLTSKNLLIKNIFMNIVTQGFPLIIAVFTIPMIIRGLGTEKFSILTLIWMIIGYTSIFDLGLGRALTQLVSKKLGTEDIEDLSVTIWTSLALIAAISLMITTILFLLAPIFVTKIFKIPSIYAPETLTSVYMLILVLPTVIITASLKGILEAHQKFAILGLLKLPIAFFNYIGPLLVLPFSKSLVYTVGMLVIGRIIIFILHIIACLKIVDNLLNKIHFSKKYVKDLLSFGGWITVSNIFTPIMTNMDRYYIASALSALIVAFYTVPFDMLVRLWILPDSITGVMFPAFSMEFQRDKIRAKRLYVKAVKYIFFIMILPIVFILLFAKIGLSIWINPTFADKSFHIAQLIAIGILVNSIGEPAYALIQASGRSDITAKIHMLEFPVYIFLLWFLVRYLGLVGAALAWVIRFFIDTIILNILAIKILKN